MQVNTTYIVMISDTQVVYFLTVFLPAYLLFRTIKRNLPSLLGGG